MSNLRIERRPLLAALMLALSATTSAGDWRAKVDARIDAAFRAKAAAQVQVLIEPTAFAKQHVDTLALSAATPPEQRPTAIHAALAATAKRNQRALVRWLDERAIAHRDFVVIDRIVATLDAQQIAELAARDDVAKLHFDAPMKALPVEQSLAKDACSGDGNPTWGLTKIGAPTVWSTYGVRGAGVVVAGQDTGYDWDHPALQPQYRGWNGAAASHNYNWHDAIHGDHPGSTGANSCGYNLLAPCDDGSHGTHTMGTMVGFNGGNRIVGVAPDAKWIGCRNMEEGYGFASTYIECFNWFLAPTDLNGQNPDPAMSPHVINNSWGCATTAEGEDCDDDDLDQFDTVIDNLTAAGILVVASAGNSGSACSTVNAPPAMSENAFGVGNTTSSDAIAGSSSRGPVTRAGRNLLKPDVSAPGSSVCSSIPGTGYTTMTGTSMAGPHVAGLAALVMSADPSLRRDPLAVKRIIMNTALGMTSAQSCGAFSGAAVPNAVFGMGRIDAMKAVATARLMNNGFE
ncbi:MAG TPA: S8 family serine peptidase [Patescibacteria group bacterium]|nr:S8 family serine peptidase [Patescibacteria group bacterium]